MSGSTSRYAAAPEEWVQGVEDGPGRPEKAEGGPCRDSWPRAAVLCCNCTSKSAAIRREGEG